MFTNLFRLGRDAELRFLDNGSCVADLSLAYNYGRKGEDGKYPSQWIKAQLWGNTAEALTPYLLKGAQIMATLDDIHIQEYQANDGTMRHTLNGRVVSVKLAGGTPQQNQQNQSQQNQQRAPRQQSQGGYQNQRSNNQAPSRQAPPPRQQNNSHHVEDDDIPF